MIKEIKDAGVKGVACKKCAQEQGTKLGLSKCGINFFTGELLSNWLLEKNLFYQFKFLFTIEEYNALKS